MDDDFAGLDPVACRALAAEFREIAAAFGDDAREMARIDREGMLNLAGSGVELLFETEDDLVAAAVLLERKCAEVEAIVWMTPDGAVDVVRKNFELLDTGGGKHDAEGIVSADDLVAVGETSKDMELLQALSLMNGGVFHMLDTGGRPKQKGDQRFSEFDLDVVKEKDISFTDLTTHAATLAANTKLLDTAAHGGKADGTYSVNDLKALVKNADCDPKLKVAVDYFLKNQDQLRLVEGFKASQAHIGVRIIKGLGGAVPTLTHVVNPVSLGIDFVRKPYETTQRQISFYKGAGGAVVGMGKGLWEVEKSVDPFYGLIDPAGQRKARLQWKEAGVAAWRHPGKAFEMIIDIETLENDPDRWVGQLAPDVIISALSGGGAVTKGVKVARAFKQLRHLDDFKALTKMNKLRALSKVSKGVTINIALHRAEDLAETTAKTAEDIAKVAAKTDTVTGPTPTIPATSKADDIPDVGLKIEPKPDGADAPDSLDIDQVGDKVEKPNIGPMPELVPGGGLTAHEAAGGHTLERHVNVTDEDLAARLTAQPNIPAASRFTDAPTAESAVAANLKVNDSAIKAWLANGATNSGSAFSSVSADTVGVSLLRGANEAVPVLHVRVVLRPDAAMPNGYRILTAYPEV